MRLVAKVKLQPFYPHERDSVHIVQETGWVPRPVWNGTENIAATGMWYIYIYIYMVRSSVYRPGVAQRLSRGISLFFHDCGSKSGWVVSSTPRPHFTPRKEPVPILQEALWAPGPVWTGGKFHPHRNLIPDRPARSQSLYRLSCRPHTHTHIYRVSPDECTGLRESVPYVKVYRYNPKYLYPKLNGYGDKGQRKVGASSGSKYCNLDSWCVTRERWWPWEWNAVLIVPAWRLVACTGVGSAM